MPDSAKKEKEDAKKLHTQEDKEADEKEVRADGLGLSYAYLYLKLQSVQRESFLVICFPCRLFFACKKKKKKAT